MTINETLMISNALVALTMALTFYLADRADPQPYWSSWSWSNIAISLSMIAMMSERLLPEYAFVAAPNFLLCLGFMLRWKAARDFRTGSSSEPQVVALVPTAVTVLILVCANKGAFGSILAIVNMCLAITAIAVAVEFGRVRAVRTQLSRHGLIASYTLVGVALFSRAIQGFSVGATLDVYLPDDDLLTTALAVGLIHLTISGSLALSLAYERAADELRDQASRDALTGLQTRRAFSRDVSKILETKRAGRCAVVLFDLDYFKSINDRYGHMAGDQVLRVAASIARKTIDKEFPLARWGGEEFAVFIHSRDPHEVRALAEAVRLNLKQTPIVYRQHAIEISVSAGICYETSDLPSLDEMLRLADEALYSSKHAGRNRTEIVTRA